MNWENKLQERVAEVQAVIQKFLPEETGYQKTVLEAMNYSVLAGGKRLRPMLMQETYRLFGGNGEIVEPFMAAIEMIHTYSLVHDDLPSMDNDEYRRGRKTTHVVYGEGMAILAGDGLLNYAFETALRAFDLEPANPAIGKAMQVLAKKAGIYGMIGGQTADIEAEGSDDITTEQLLYIHENKTGALLIGYKDDNNPTLVEAKVSPVGFALLENNTKMLSIEKSQTYLRNATIDGALQIGMNNGLKLLDEDQNGWSFII